MKRPLPHSLTLWLLWLLFGAGAEQKLHAQSCDGPDWSITFFTFDTTGGTGCHELLSFQMEPKGVMQHNSFYDVQDGRLQEWMDLPPFPRERFYHDSSEKGLIAEATFTPPVERQSTPTDIVLTLQAHLPEVLDTNVSTDEVLLRIEVHPFSTETMPMPGDTLAVTRQDLMGDDVFVDLQMYRSILWPLRFSHLGQTGTRYRIRLYWTGREEVMVRSVEIAARNMYSNGGEQQ